MTTYNSKPISQVQAENFAWYDVESTVDVAFSDIKAEIKDAKNYVDYLQKRLDDVRDFIPHYDEWGKLTNEDTVSILTKITDLLDDC
jgi:hypothetical protein